MIDRRITGAIGKYNATSVKPFSALLALCEGNSLVTREFPSQRPVTRGFGVLFDLRLNKGCANNRDADHLRRHRAHYDVAVMSTLMDWVITNSDNRLFGAKPFTKSMLTYCQMNF